MQSSKPKLTPHRLAAANPEVKELIQKLKRIWKHASPEAKRKAVTELLEKGCSIRGLAEDTGIADPTIRLALKVKPTASKRARKTPHRVPSKTDARAKKPASDQEKTQLPVHLQKGADAPHGAQKATHQTPPISKLQAGRPMAQPAPAGVGMPQLKPAVSSQVPPKKIELPPRPSPQPPQEAIASPEATASLRKKAEQIIVDLVRAELRSVDESKARDEITSAFQMARTMIVMNRPGVRLVPLPAQLTIAELLRRTKPVQNDNGPRWEYVGRWIALIVNSLNPDDQWARDHAVDQAERRLLPKQENVVKVEPSGAGRSSPRRIAQIEQAYFLWDPRRLR